VLVKTDNPFQRRARLQQALWREQRGYPIGLHRGKPLGSRIAMPFAQETLANYLSPTIQQVVRREVLDAPPGHGRLFGRPRIFDDLLSSQPLCFNLFAELAEDLELATRLIRALPRGDDVGRVVRVDFEHSPGRSDPRFTGDRSAFDVFVAYESRSGPAGFLGIEVKYHEDLVVKAAAHRDRYDEVAKLMGCFHSDAFERLRARPLQQIWRDHLLTGAVVAAKIGYDRGTFVFLAPSDNDACTRATNGYRSCLSSESSLIGWALEDVFRAIREQGGGQWAEEGARRYVDFTSLADAVSA